MRISDWSSDVCSSDLRAMGEALDATEGKALIFCRTGMRSTTLWALAQADRKPVAHLLGAADAAGYDLALHAEWPTDRPPMARRRLPASVDPTRHAEGKTFSAHVGPSVPPYM